MDYAQQDVWTMQIVYLLIARYNYKIVTAQQTQPNDEIWLANPKHFEFPVIRITKMSVDRVIFEKNRLMQMHKAVLGLFNREGSLLDIHVTKEEAVNDDIDIKQCCIADNYLSGVELKKVFPDITVQQVEDPQGEFIKLSKKLEEQQMKAMNSYKKDWRNYPVVTMGVLIVCILVCFLANFISYNTGSIEMGMIYGGGLYKTLVYGSYEWFRIITAGFLHVDMWHLFCNAIALMNLGVLCEKAYGRRDYFIILMVSITTGSLFALIGGGNGVTLGISGGVFGLLAATIVYFYRMKLLTQKPILFQIFRILLLNIIISLLPGISWLGHLGGFVGGLFMSIIVSNEIDWNAFRKNSMVALLSLMMFLVYYGVVKDTKLQPIYPQVDVRIIETARDWGLDGYANFVEKNLVDYYYNRVGVKR